MSNETMRVTPVPHESHIESMLMAFYCVTLIPILLAFVMAPAVWELQGGTAPLPPFLFYLLAAAVGGASVFDVVNQGKYSAKLLPPLREYHEARKDERVVPTAVYGAYIAVRALPDLLMDTDASAQELASATLMVERSEELVTAVAELQAASQDADWVLRQAPTQALIAMGHQALDLKGKIQDLKLAHLTLAALPPSESRSDLLDLQDALDQQLDAVRQALD